MSGRNWDLEVSLSTPKLTTSQQTLSTRKSGFELFSRLLPRVNAHHPETIGTYKLVSSWPPGGRRVPSRGWGSSGDTQAWLLRVWVPQSEKSITSPKRKRPPHGWTRPRSEVSSAALTVFLMKPVVFERQTAAAALAGGFTRRQALGSAFLSELEMIITRRRDSERGQ